MRIERQEVINILVKELMQDHYDLIDKLTDGFIGYASYSDKALKDEWKELFDEEIIIVND